MPGEEPGAGLAARGASPERWSAWASIAAGLVVAAASTRVDRFFFPNFAWWWGPQALLLALLLASRARPAIVAGAALALLLDLLAFKAWVHGASPAEKRFVVYPFQFPGALLGALAAVVLSRRRPAMSAPAAALAASSGTLLGIAVAVWAFHAW